MQSSEKVLKKFILHITAVIFYALTLNHSLFAHFAKFGLLINSPIKGLSHQIRSPNNHMVDRGLKLGNETFEFSIVFLKFILEFENDL